MKMLLCSDFSGVGYKFLNRIISNPKGRKCLFINYAREDINDTECSAKDRLDEAGFEVVFLQKDFDFNQNFDMIFCRGGNVGALIDRLREFNQYDKIKNMIKKGTVYVGNSAGTILVGTETDWTLESEPYEVDMTLKYGKNAMDGFCLVDKIFIPHTGKYFMGRPEDADYEGEKFRTLNSFFYPITLKERKILKGKNLECIKNNEVILIDGEIYKKLKYDWSKIPVKNI